MREDEEMSKERLFLSYSSSLYYQSVLSLSLTSLSPYINSHDVALIRWYGRWRRVRKTIDYSQLERLQLVWTLKNEGRKGRIRKIVRREVTNEVSTDTKMLLHSQIQFKKIYRCPIDPRSSYSRDDSRIKDQSKMYLLSADYETKGVETRGTITR